MYDCGIQIPGAGNCKVSKTLGNKPFPNKQMKMFGDSRDKISYTSRRCHGRLLHTKKDDYEIIIRYYNHVDPRYT